MTIKTKIILASSAIILSFALGRYSARTASQKQAAISHAVTKAETHEHKVTTITQDKKGDTKTIIVEDQTSETAGASTSTVHESTPVSKYHPLNISALAAIDFHTGLPVYGASVSKEILDPVTVGAWGLNNGTIGVSIGIDF